MNNLPPVIIVSPAEQHCLDYGAYHTGAVMARRQGDVKLSRVFGELARKCLARYRIARQKLDREMAA